MVRLSYSASKKLKIISYAEEHGNQAASRLFGLSECNVHRWRTQKSKLKTMPASKRADRSTNAQFPVIDQIVSEWVAERREQGIGISIPDICYHSLQIAQQQGISNFKASHGWCRHVMSRHHLSVKRRTTIAQRLPEDFEDKIVGFQRYIIKLRKEHDYDLSCIGNADQTPLTFDLPYSRNVHNTGEKSVIIRSTGNDKTRFTVMLACLGDGTKLPPYVIFKRKTLPKTLSIPSGIFVRCHAKGWMDEKLMLDCLKTVWGVSGNADRRLLILDAFCCHRMTSVTNKLKEIDPDLAIIPGGMTSMLQVLDVVCNRPFKVTLQKLWNNWMMDGLHTFTASGRQRKPDLDTILIWIKSAWDCLDSEIIKKGFKRCCINNALDGSEDDEVFNHLLLNTDREHEEEEQE